MKVSSPLKSSLTLSILLASFFLTACNSSDKNEHQQASTNTPSVSVPTNVTPDAVPETPAQTNTSNADLPHPGKKLYEAKCTVCHGSSAPENERIAPPMVGIKAHYITAETTKEEFILSVQAFVDEPSKEKSKMPGAVRKFGLMPYQQFTPEDIALIGEYLFDYKIEEPKWFKEHWQQGNGDSSYFNDGKEDITQIQKTPADIGMQYALGTKKELGENLMGTINAKGTLEAVNFCNQQAYPLTAKKAEEYGASIKRVSDKPRNQTNQANAAEIEYIETFKSMLAKGESPKPIVISTENTHQYYAPIVTNTMCLQCHGDTDKQIKADVFDKIQALYPNDKATGYKANQVRGIWRVEFPNESNL